ncbi:hypothetical protein BDP27DRAFT_637504 [Rhodocollybia butyracea]|uniref:SNF2 N-terminal domain-containing protein n=1 Tax=Rhodocollybia butyracea TaxID=206335 RepID=A0A9P5U7Q9_9AGAR|nr:hypothetical protein BDP27DRAFT_637504 [Rhodocollybia butyracea]
MWWRAILQTHLDSAAKEKKRVDQKLKALEDEISQVLGENFLSLELETSFTADKARDILNNLLNYSSALSWTAVTKSDIRVMEKVFQSAGLHDAGRIRERWNLLSQNGKRTEFPMMALGWLLGVLERKNHEEHEPLELEDDDLEIVQRGILLARSIDQQIIDKIQEPSRQQLDKFHATVADFTTQWLQGDEADNIDTVIALYEGHDVEATRELFFEGDNDIGVERWRSTPLEEVHHHLGLEDGLPDTFRQNFSDDHSEVIISWHQLVFVCAFIAQYVDSQRAEVPEILYKNDEANRRDALQGIREEWGRNPAVALLDDVGLGKTVCCLAGIGTLQTLFRLEDAVKKGDRDRSTLPACIRDAVSFGGRAEGLPECPHLIIVPSNLSNQWKEELHRFFRAESVQIITIPTAARKWADTMKQIYASRHPKERIIILVTHQVG